MGVRRGDAITVHYDPMIAKLIVWDRDRNAAARRLQAALVQYEVAGVHTSLDLLRRIAAHPAFLAAELDIGFLGRRPELLALSQARCPSKCSPSQRPRPWRGAPGKHGLPPTPGTDRHSPWASATAWRLNGLGYQTLLSQAGTDHNVRTHPRPEDSFGLEVGGQYLAVARPGPETLVRDGVRSRVPMTRTDPHSMHASPPAR